MKIAALASYRSTFSMLRASLLFMVVAYVLTVLGLVAYHYKTIEKINSRVYLIENSGNVMTAEVKSFTKAEKEIMVRDHVTDFYRSFFAFDQFTFETNTERALLLIGSSGKKIYEEYVQEDVPRYLKSSSAVVTIEIEELIVDMDSNVPRVRVKAIQTTRTGRTEGKRRLISNVFWISETSRNIDNPHGLLIEDFELVNVENIEE